MDGKTCHWCPKHLAWTLHTPEDCRMEEDLQVNAPNAEALAAQAITDNNGKRIGRCLRGTRDEGLVLDLKDWAPLQRLQMQITAATGNLGRAVTMKPQPNPEPVTLSSALGVQLCGAPNYKQRSGCQVPRQNTSASVRRYETPFL